MTVAEMLGRMDSRELTEWMGYARLISSRPEDLQSLDDKLSKAFGNG